MANVVGLVLGVCLAACVWVSLQTILQDSALLKYRNLTDLFVHTSRRSYVLGTMSSTDGATGTSQVSSTVKQGIAGCHWKLCLLL